MSYFVTGATGFIGRHLVEQLLDHREGTIFVLVRESSLPRMQKMVQVWDTDRVVPVVGDLAGDRLGVDDAWVTDRRGAIDPFFPPPAGYDMTPRHPTHPTPHRRGPR